MPKQKETFLKNEYARVYSKRLDASLYDNVYVHEILCTKIKFTQTKEIFRVPMKKYKGGTLNERINDNQRC